MPFLIAIAGGSGSGKTTLARTLIDALPEETASANAAERAAAMWERFHGIRRRYVL